MNKRLLTAIFTCCFIGTLPPNAGAQGNLEAVRNLVNKGNNLMRARHFAEAISAYQEALKVDPGNVIAKGNIAEAHNNWGINYFGQHKYKEAAAEWQKCIELAPGHANAKRNLTIMMRTLAQQGVNLNEEDPGAAASGSSPDGELNKSIVNKASASGKPAPAATPGALTPKTDVSKAPENDAGPSGAVMILTPGLRQPSATPPPVTSEPVGFSGGGSAADVQPPSSTAVVTTPPPAAAAPPQSAYTVPASGFAPNGITPAYSPNAGTATGFSPNGISPNYDQGGSASLTGKTPVSPLFPVTPQQFVQPTTPPGMSTGAAGASMSSPAGSSGGSIAGTAGGAGSGAPGAAGFGYTAGHGASSLEDQLGAVELKVYGQKQSGMTVMQRIEKVERDTSGSPRPGTIIERIDSLKQSFGIQ